MSEETRDEGVEKPNVPGLHRTEHTPEHLAILKKGAAAWNKWREDNPEVKPDLRELNLSAADLGHDELKECNLAGANLVSVRLKRADLREALLEGAELQKADLEGADLSGAHLEGARLAEAHLQEATLVSAHLEGASLVGADLEKANLFIAHLERADLRAVRRMRLDATMVRNAQFSPRARDPWSVLRRGYTGPKLMFNLLFLVVFLVPYAVKTAGWVMVNRMQDELAQGVEQLELVADELEANQDPASRPIRAVLAAIMERLPAEGNDRWRESRVWRLVLGVDRGVTFWLTAVLLIAYNILRAILTWFVGPMRDEEERSGYAPLLWRVPRTALPAIRWWRSPADWWDLWFAAYGWLYRLHRVAVGLLFFAILSFGWHAVNWLILPVWIPAT